MNRNRIALITFLALAMSRAADAGTTFYFNPTLDRESNPAARLGAEGKTFLTINVLLAWISTAQNSPNNWR